MECDKHRLELALYSRPKHLGTYCYALFVTTKSTRHKPAITGIKHHVENTLTVIDDQVAQPWRYGELELSDINSEPRLLMRVIIGKLLVPPASVGQILQTVPAYQVDDAAHRAEATSYSCRIWMQVAVETLGGRNAVKLKGDWAVLDAAAREYVQRKDVQGRWDVGGTGVPMLDLFNNMEVVD